MGQPGYPNAHRVGVANLWNHSFISTPLTINLQFEINIFQQFLTQYIELIGGNYVGLNTRLVQLTWSLYELRHFYYTRDYNYLQTYMHWRHHYLRLWCLCYNNWLVLVLYFILRRIVQHKWYTRQALYYWRSSMLT